MLEAGVATVLTSVFQMKEIPVSLFRVTCWAMSVLCKDAPGTDFTKLQPFLPYFARLLDMLDPDVVSDTLWALAHLTEDLPDAQLLQVARKVPARTILKLVERCTDAMGSIRVPALRALGNLCTGSVDCIEDVMTPSSLQVISQQLATLKEEGSLADVCWIVANLASGTPAHLQKLIVQGIIRQMCQLVLTSTSQRVKMHATYALMKASEQGTEKQLWTMVGQGILEALDSMLCAGRADILKHVLKGLDNVLTAGQGGEDDLNEIAKKFEELDGFRKVAELQQHPNPAIAERVHKLIDNFYEPLAKLEAEGRSMGD